MCEGGGEGCLYPAKMFKSLLKLPSFVNTEQKCPCGERSGSRPASGCFCRNPFKKPPKTHLLGGRAASGSRIGPLRVEIAF